jgi:hypothetical protein
MRVYLLILAGLPLVAQIDTNMACVERLEIPTYPALAKQARIAGVLTASVRLGPEGSIGKISSQFVPESTKSVMFASAIEESLRASIFAKSCAGKQVRLVFNFVLSEPGVSTQTTFSFGYPNQFWVVAHFRTYVD